MATTLDQIGAYQAACRELNDATEAVDGTPDNDQLSREFIGPYTRQIRHFDRGGDPTELAGSVAAGRARVVSALMARDELPVAQAQAAVGRLEDAYLAWRLWLSVSA